MAGYHAKIRMVLATLTTIIMVAIYQESLAYICLLGLNIFAFEGVFLCGYDCNEI